MNQRSLGFSPNQILPVALVVLVPAVVLVFSPEYLLFHSFAELFVAAVALVVFSIAWHTRRIASTDYLTFIGLASLPFALVIMLHTLSYKGMPLFLAHDADLPTQYWLIARTIQASAFVIAPWYATRKLRRPGMVLLAYGLVAMLAVIAAYSGNFPAAFIEGQGLTPFKVWTEYVVIVSMGLAALGLYAKRTEIHPYVRTLLWIAMAAIAVAEIAFTLYTDPFGLWNRIGHVLHVAAAVAIYGALVHSSLEQPLETMFMRLRLREAELADAYREEHQIAETLQSAMSLQPTSVEGLDLAHRYLPAEGIGRIGGDFYDLFRIEGDLVGFVIGDVCGKGLRAASTTFRVRSVLRAFALSDRDTAAVLESVNHYLINELEEDMFVTCVYGTIDTRTGETCYAVAGHPEPIVCGRPDFDLLEEERATPLGVIEPLDAKTHRMVLNPGDGLVLVTDGVIDAPGADGRFGMERLHEVLHGPTCPADADALLDAVLAAVHRFSGEAVREDDVALLGLRFTPRS